MYAVQVQSRLTVRLRSPLGELITKHVSSNENGSVAITVERYDASGKPVLATNASRFASQRALGPVSALLSGFQPDAIPVGKSWAGAATISLPYGTVALRLTNVTGSQTSGGAGTSVAITIGGDAGLSGAVSLPDLGRAALRGGGSASGSAYVDLERRLLRAMQLTAHGTGTATTRDRRGTYSVTVRYAIALARFVPGSIPPSAVPGFAPASTYNLNPMPVDATNQGPMPLATIGQPAPVDTEYAPLSQPGGTPTPVPALSLPPVPLPMPSGQSLVSPPPAPTPTPTWRPR